MPKAYIRRFLKARALDRGQYVSLWKRLGRPSPEEWTGYLIRHGGFQSIGQHCWINPAAIFTDPYLTSIGNNVRIAGGWFGGHDGSINMLNRAFGTKFDSVAPLRIGDNVFVGVGCHVLPGAVIGNNSIVGAGSVVTGHLKGDAVYAGVPARKIRSMQDHLAFLQQRTDSYPWQYLIETRVGGFDSTMEPELKRQRVRYFFGGKSISGGELQEAS